ncbi:Uma2 family endonuclease [Actinomadura vinacea]
MAAPLPLNEPSTIQAPLKEVDKMGALPEWMLSLPDEGITAEQYDRMPVEDCRNIEIVDGSIVVSPAATPRHNEIAMELAHALKRAAPPPWRATIDSDLRISEVPLTNRRPDVLVYRGDPRNRPVLPGDALLAVEIMSTGSVSTDRFSKPVEYAQAGIPHYWRLEENSSGLTTYTFALNPASREYSETGAYHGALKTEQPFPFDIDLPALL